MLKQINSLILARRHLWVAGGGLRVKEVSRVGMWGSSL